MTGLTERDDTVPAAMQKGELPGNRPRQPRAGAGIAATHVALAARDPRLIVRPDANGGVALFVAPATARET